MKISDFERRSRKREEEEEDKTEVQAINEEVSSKIFPIFLNHFMNRPATPNYNKTKVTPPTSVRYTYISHLFVCARWCLMVILKIYGREEKIILNNNELTVYTLLSNLSMFM